MCVCVCVYIFLSTLFSNTTACVLSAVWKTKFHTHTKQHAKS
jgi:hypothetical protein